MKTIATLVALCALFAVHPASAEEDQQAAQAIEAFKAFVAAAKANDGGKIGYFISHHDWAALAKSGKKDDLISAIDKAQ